jgi:hypothetical protein
MKQHHIVAATLVLLTGISLQSQAQSPTIQRELRLVSPSTGTGFVGLKASAGTSTYTLSMPATAPAANQVLTVSNISGANVSLAWNSPDATGWSLTGNAGTTASNFLGTTDAQPLVIKTNGSSRVTVAADGAITMNSLSGAAGSASGTATNEGVVISNTNGLVTKASYASVVSAGLSTSTTGLTVGGPFTVTGLLTANSGLTVAGGSLNVTGANPLQLNGAAGNAGEILQSNGAGAAPTWSNAFVKGRGLVAVTANESIAVAAASVDADDAINVTLEGSTNDLAIPSYYIVRTASTGFTIYFSAPFTGSCNWSVINQ